MTAPLERWADGPAVLESVWRHRWLVLAATVAFGLGGYFLAAAQPEEYEASTRLFLSDPETAGVFGQTAESDIDRYLPQQTQRVTSSPVLTATAELLGDTSADALRWQVEASGNAELATLTITATAGSGQRAADIANAVATAYEDNVRITQVARVERATTELERSQADIESQIAELEAEGTAGDGQINVLLQRLAEMDTLIQQLRVDARLFGTGVEFVEAAEPPQAPTAPRPRRSAIMTALLGGILGAAVAYWLSGRKGRIASQDEPGVVLGVPLLGALPTYNVRTDGPLRERAELDPRTKEAYRFVFSSLEVILRERGATSVMVTSAGPNTGKTETSLQLAVTAQQRRGGEVLLVDADLRMRGLSTFLRAERDPGMLDLVADPDLDPVDLISDYPLDDHHELRILTAGHHDGDTSQHVSERWFGRAFERLVQSHELTIVDSPPLLAVADTATIAGYTDAVVLIIREGSPVGDLERVKQRLRFAGQRLVGYVYLSPTALEDTAFDYGLVRERAWQSLGPRATTKPEPRTEDREVVPADGEGTRDDDVVTVGSDPAEPPTRQVPDEVVTARHDVRPGDPEPGVAWTEEPEPQAAEPRPGPRIVQPTSRAAETVLPPPPADEEPRVDLEDPTRGSAPPPSAAPAPAPLPPHVDETPPPPPGQPAQTGSTGRRSDADAADEEADDEGLEGVARRLRGLLPRREDERPTAVIAPARPAVPREERVQQLRRALPERDGGEDTEAPNGPDGHVGTERREQLG